MRRSENDPFREQVLVAAVLAHDEKQKASMKLFLSSRACVLSAQLSVCSALRLRTSSGTGTGTRSI